MTQVDRNARLGDYNHATDPQYKKLRDEADRLYQRRQQLSNQSQQAYKQGDKARAKDLSDQAKQVGSQAEDKNFEAALFVFRENNADSAPDEIDLHGLFVKEAEAILRRRIQEAVQNNQLHLRVIVGKGLHSKGGIAKLKPAVDQMCDDNNLKHFIDPKNAGVLVIELSPNLLVQAPQQAYHGTSQPQYHQQLHNSNGGYTQQSHHNASNNDMLAKIGKIFCRALCSFLNK